MKKLIIFDLDGTLLDTVEDLAVSVNHALGQCGHPTHSTDDYKLFIGKGINNLFRRALPEEHCSEENVMRMRELFLAYYDKHNTDFTKPYEGIPELLAKLQEKGVKLAVASNKYQAATEKLAAEFFPGIKFEVVFGQREGVPVKPDPMVVVEILSLTCIAHMDTLYIGDSGVDMQTAKNAGVESVGVKWGFRTEEELLSNGAIHTVDTPSEILPIAGVI